MDTCRWVGGWGGGGYGGPVGRALRQLRHALLEVCTVH